MLLVPLRIIRANVDIALGPPIYKALTLAEWQSHQPTTHHRRSLLPYDCEAKEMEAKKRAAAVATLCMLLLLMLSRPFHQQFSCHSCDSYRECCPRCKRTFPILCKVECGGRCDDTCDRVGSCLDACAMDSVCDLPTSPSGKTTNHLML